ncbi:unnamed protein product [Plutella xylostella]|uniref:(diamondback moth) hypothetical protein n=1 Tax=Plutella xylostella TaxID=51655 RepID=A0A8S4D5X0_PLUXY|nr:unnamed protein product [Plutella xylostella]
MALHATKKAAKKCDMRVSCEAIPEEMCATPPPAPHPLRDGKYLLLEEGDKKCDMRVSCEAIPEEMCATPPPAPHPLRDGKYLLLEEGDKKCDMRVSCEAIPEEMCATPPPAPHPLRDGQSHGGATSEPALAAADPAPTQPHLQKVASEGAVPGGGGGGGGARGGGGEDELPPLARSKRSNTISVMSPTRRRRDNQSPRGGGGRAAGGGGGMTPAFVLLQLYHNMAAATNPLPAGAGGGGAGAERPLRVAGVQHERTIKNLDLVPPVETYKVGVLYVGPGQHDNEVLILKNEYGSVRYGEFLSALGTLVELEGPAAPHLFLNLEPGGRDGRYTYVWQDDIMQHGSSKALFDDGCFAEEIVRRLKDSSKALPAHFLIGRPFTSLPAPCLLEHNTNRLDRYERLEQYKQHFWQRWTKEYICELQQRTKWRVKCKDLQLNDLVLLKDDSPPYLETWENRKTVHFHVATAMPTSPRDPTCNEKRKYIGNDHVSIVYNDSGQDFNILTIKGQLNFCIVVVEPLQHGAHRVTLKTKDQRVRSQYLQHCEPATLSDHNAALLARQLALHAADLQHCEPATLSDHNAALLARQLALHAADLQHCEPATLSDHNAALLARQLALHAALASHISQSLNMTSGMPYASNSLERLRAIKRLRARLEAERAAAAHTAPYAPRGDLARKVMMDDFTQYT